MTGSSTASTSRSSTSFTFAKAQAILADRGEHAKRRSKPSDFLLSSILRCGRCGKAYIGMSANGNGGRYHYYACTSSRLGDDIVNRTQAATKATTVAAETP